VGNIVRKTLQTLLLEQHVRLAIDEDRVDEIIQIANEHPDFDWNHLTQNGVSALWWALTPKPGKAISAEMLGGLLTLRNEEGRSAINRSQGYPGTNLSPANYLDTFPITDTPNHVLKQIISGIKQSMAVERAELNHERVVGEARVVATAENTLAHADHGANDPIVLLASDESLKRLNAIYGNALNVEDEIEEIQAFLDKKQGYDVSKQIKIQDMIGRILHGGPFSTEQRVGMAQGSGPQTLKEALALMWKAAKDENIAFLHGGNPTTEIGIAETISTRKQMVLTTLYDAETAYGDSHSCWPGTWGRLGTSLLGLHGLVRYESIPLSGEMAYHKLVALVGHQIKDLFLHQRELYWHVLRKTLRTSAVKDEDLDLDKRADEWKQSMLTIVKMGLQFWKSHQACAIRDRHLFFNSANIVVI